MMGWGVGEGRGVVAYVGMGWDVSIRRRYHCEKIERQYSERDGGISYGDEDVR